MKNNYLNMFIGTAALLSMILCVLIEDVEGTVACGVFAIINTMIFLK